ncbi:MAG: hypothetical protein ACREEJ_08285 [Ensifer adhaerens]
MASLSFIAIGIDPSSRRARQKIKNAALRRRRHYSYFAAQCQQNQALQCGRTGLIHATKKSRGGACKNATPTEQVGEN